MCVNYGTCVFEAHATVVDHRRLGSPFLYSSSLGSVPARLLLRHSVVTLVFLEPLRCSSESDGEERCNEEDG